MVQNTVANEQYGNSRKKGETNHFIIKTKPTNYHVQVKYF